MLPWFMVSVYSSRLTINAISLFYTCLENRQQFFLTPAIVAFCQSILATMVCDRMQTIIILLKQYNASCIFASISINYERFCEVWKL